MDVTNRFVLDFALRFAAERPGARLLDYGCGSGAVVAEGRARGLDYVGADAFYGGSEARSEAARSGLLGSVVFPMDEGRIPFGDGCFDLVTNNQVLEHVADLDATLGEICRVLKPHGVLLSIFPSRDVLREGHIGIPFSHWFPRDSRARFYYTWMLRSLGLGLWKEQAPTCRAWAEAKLRWLDAYVRYRTRQEIFRAFDERFTTERRETDYIRYRLCDSRRLAPLARLLDLPGVPPLAEALFRKLAFLVLVSRRKTD